VPHALLELDGGTCDEGAIGGVVRSVNREGLIDGSEGRGADGQRGLFAN